LSGVQDLSRRLWRHAVRERQPILSLPETGRAFNYSRPYRPDWALVCSKARQKRGGIPARPGPTDDRESRGCVVGVSLRGRIELCTQQYYDSIVQTEQIVALLIAERDRPSGRPRPPRRWSNAPSAPPGGKRLRRQPGVDGRPSRPARRRRRRRRQRVGVWIRNRPRY
jgi:hypothetical protein